MLRVIFEVFHATRWFINLIQWFTRSLPIPIPFSFSCIRFISLQLIYYLISSVESLGDKRFVLWQFISWKETSNVPWLFSKCLYFLLRSCLSCRVWQQWHVYRSWHVRVSSQLHWSAVSIWWDFTWSHSCAFSSFSQSYNYLSILFLAFCQSRR